MYDTKASRLEQLSGIVPVPSFTCLSRSMDRKMKLDQTKRYIVRSSSRSEDQKDHSQAGQFATYGPLNSMDVEHAIDHAFEDQRVEDVIVQEFVDGPDHGVVFCLSATKMIVEYSTVFEGVTSGMIAPFTALLPCDIERYAQLQKFLVIIFEHFGPSDVEFVNIADPQFVQVRPITRSFTFDKEQVQLKMNLQEIEPSHWIENDVCSVIAERMERSAAIVDVYISGLKGLYSDVLYKKLKMPQKAFLRISDQYFMAKDLHDQLKPSFWMMLRLAVMLPFHMNTLKNKVLLSDDPVLLMQWSIYMSMAYDIFKRKIYFSMRENLRIRLNEVLKNGEYECDGVLSRPLGASINWNRNNNTWEQFEYRDSRGIVVVEGNMEGGPFFHMRSKDAVAPKEVVIVTEHLYPEIGKFIPGIKGIICKNGALTSHVAILAREYSIPLIIQTEIDVYV